MAEPFLAEIVLFAGNFAPSGWAFCNGQLLSIAQNSALFSIIGTIYGGDGQTNLTSVCQICEAACRSTPAPAPDSPHERWDRRAEPRINGLTANEGPAHSHAAGASSLHGNSSTPVENKLAVSSAGTGLFSPTADATMAADFVQTSGTGAPHNNMQPYLALNYIIALSGVYPSPP